MLYRIALITNQLLSDALQQSSLKPDTTLQLDIDDCNNSNENDNNLDDTPPAMIIVETCINSITDSHVVSTTKQTEKEIPLTMEQPAEQAGCSITLGLKPNVQFNLLPQNVAISSGEQLLLSSTEAALAAANISTCATSDTSL